MTRRRKHPDTTLYGVIASGSNAGLSDKTEDGEIVFPDDAIPFSPLSPMHGGEDWGEGVMR